MKFIYPLFFFCLLFSCSQSPQKAAPVIVAAAPAINEQSTDTIYIPTKDEIAASSFFKNYIETVLVDSVTMYQGKKISVVHTPITTGYLLPRKYILDKYTKHKKPFIYFTQTGIIIGENTFLINKDQVNTQLDSSDDQLKKYGVLLLYNTDITLEKNLLHLSYSYSIPYTDLGRAVNVFINMDTGEKLFKVE